MEETVKIRKSFVLQAYEEACEQWKRRIRREVPELFKMPKLEVGRWYKGDRHFNTLLFITKIENEVSFNRIYFYGFIKGRYTQDEYIANSEHEESLVEATAEEVQEALIVEAKCRGFKVGTKFESIVGNENGNKISREGFDFDAVSNRLYANGGVHGVVFNKGTWAEPIKPVKMTKKQIEDKLGYSIELI